MQSIDPFTADPKLALLKDIPYIDYPEIRIDEHEITEMPFRYVKDADGKPVMPEVSPHVVASLRAYVLFAEVRRVLLIWGAGNDRSD